MDYYCHSQSNVKISYIVFDTRYATSQIYES